MTSLKAVTSKFKQGHYLYLLIALLVQLLAFPFFEATAGKGIGISILSSITVIVAIYAAGMGKKQLWVALGLGGFAFLGIWYVLFIEPRYYVAMISVISRLAFFVYLIALILISLFRAKQVTPNTIYGVASVYMLIGFSFAILYIFMESFWSGSFYIDASRNLDGRLDFSDFVYLSFTTLTTLGYGDITPISPYARSATSLQAILGVLYIAILISRFVSIFILQSSRTDSNGIQT